jgi:hypothetical protein
MGWGREEGNSSHGAMHTAVSLCGTNSSTSCSALKESEEEEEEKD